MHMNDSDKSSGTAERAFGPVGVTSRTSIAEPRYRMLHELDARAVENLVAYLVNLRSIRFYLMTIMSTVVGVLFFPFNLSYPWSHKVIMGLSLTGSVAFFVGAVATLAIRHLFLRESAVHGCSQTTAILMMVFAERRARTLFLVLDRQTRLQCMIQAVRDAQEIYSKT